MDLWVMEGQIRGGYFPDYILDPSVIDCTGQAVPEMVAGGLPGDQRLTSSGLPTGWTMQLMDNGKVRATQYGQLVSS